MWVGGGVAHGPKPRKYTKRVNKKVKRVALQSALTDRANLDAVIVVRDLAFETPKTKDAVAALDALGLADRKTLVVLADRHAATEKSFRNLSHIHTLVVDQLNTHDVLNADVVVFAEPALELIGTGQRAGAKAEEVEA
jgi:large subunit ribosomal protein L4